MPSGASTLAAPELYIPALGLIDRESLLASCRRARDRARQSRRAVLVSWAKPMSLSDPVEIWSRARRTVSRSFMWQSAWDGGSVVAFGSAHDMRGRGDGRIASVRLSWAALSRDIVTGGTAEAALPAGEGPLAIGGFAFSPGNASDEQRLPDALMWVPAVQIRSGMPTSGAADPAVAAELRLNAMLTHDSEPHEVAERLAELADLCLLASADDDWQLLEPAAERTHRCVDLPSADDWKDLVRRATDRIREGHFEKVVLARELRVTASTPFDAPAIVNRLRAANPGTTLFAVDHADRTFLGATPEYLVRVSGRSVHALGLAGTTPRGVTPEQDRALERELIESPKLQHEHAIVVQMLADDLRDACADVTVQTPPSVVKLANVQHLSTEVRGRIPEDSRVGVLDFVDRLHPTPALGGHPRKESLGWLSDNEGLDRSWYAGVVGWADQAGQGQFAVAIRSALLDGASASLYAGCGLVADSDPEAEFAETCAKLRLMRSALEID